MAEEGAKLWNTQVGNLPFRIVVQRLHAAVRRGHVRGLQQSPVLRVRRLGYEVPPRSAWVEIISVGAGARPAPAGPRHAPTASSASPDVHELLLADDNEQSRKQRPHDVIIVPLRDRGWGADRRAEWRSFGDEQSRQSDVFLLSPTAAAILVRWRGQGPVLQQHCVTAPARQTAHVFSRVHRHDTTTWPRAIGVSVLGHGIRL